MACNTAATRWLFKKKINLMQQFGRFYFTISLSLSFKFNKTSKQFVCTCLYVRPKMGLDGRVY